MHSQQLSALEQNIHRWALHHNIQLLAEGLLGVDNDFAGLLSRMRQQVYKWELHPQVLLLYFRRLWFPNVDLFATNENTSCQSFASRFPLPQYMANAV